MPSRRGSIALTEEEKSQLLKDGWTLQVASVGPKGFPHLVAMWYVLDETGKIVFTTFRKSQKIINLRRNPKMTVMLEAGRAYQELLGLVIEGTAEVVDDPAYTAKVMAKVGEKYNGIPAPMETPDAALKVAGKRVVVRLQPEDIYSWDHRKLGGVY
jgi:PPOX class probable F420-dependent enzyme